MTHNDPVDDQIPIEPDNTSLTPLGDANSVSGIDASPKLTDPSPATPQPNAYCFSCGYNRAGVSPDLPCPECGRSPDAPRCTFCGYELTGLQVTENCPECGKPIWDSNISPPTSGLSIASMVLGIVSLISCMLYGIPAIILGPLAIIFGEIALRQHKNGLRAGNTKGFALTGRICGWIGFAAGGTVVGLMIWAFSNM